MKNNPKNELPVRIAANTSKLCVWCESKPRYYLSRYCGNCRNAYYRWGHPDGRQLPPDHYQSIKEQCVALLDLNRDKDAVKYALRYCTSYLNKAEKESQIIPNPMRSISELAWRGVTAEEMLLEAMAVYIYCSGRTSSSPYSIATHQVGNAVLKLRKWHRPYTITGNYRKDIGSYLIGPLRPLFEKFKEAIQQAENSKQHRQRVMENIQLDGLPELTVDNG